MPKRNKTSTIGNGNVLKQSAIKSKKDATLQTFIESSNINSPEKKGEEHILDEHAGILKKGEIKSVPEIAKKVVIDTTENIVHTIDNEKKTFLPLSEQNLFSHSNSNEVLVTYMDLKWALNIWKGIINAEVTLEFEQLIEGKTKLILDIKDIVILGVKHYISHRPMNFEISEETEFLGQSLTIDLNENINKYKRSRVVIYYKKTNQSGYFVDFNGDEGIPIFHTENDNFTGRCLFPCQDARNVKIIYKALIQVDKRVDFLMSGKLVAKTEDEHFGYYQYENFKPLMNSSIGFVAGKFKCHPISDNITLCVMENSRIGEEYIKKIGEIPKYLEVIKQYLPDHEWTNLYIIQKPEISEDTICTKPNLCFIPYRLSKRFEIAMIQSLCHIWFKDLVSCVNLDHYWIQESFILFMSRKVKGDLQGQHTVENKIRHLKLNKHVSRKRKKFSCIAYQFKITSQFNFTRNLKHLKRYSWEKGLIFLFYLEQLLGHNGEFNQFLGDYVRHFQYSVVDTAQFIEHVKNYFKDNEEIKNIDWKLWLYGVGSIPKDVKIKIQEMKFFNMNVLLKQLNLLDLQYKYEDSSFDIGKIDSDEHDDCIYIYEDNFENVSESGDNDSDSESGSTASDIMEPSNDNIISKDTLDFKLKVNGLLIYLSRAYYNHRNRKLELFERLQKENVTYSTKFIKYLEKKLHLNSSKDEQLRFAFLMFCIHNKSNEHLYRVKEFVQECNDVKKLKELGEPLVAWEHSKKKNARIQCEDKYNSSQLKDDILNIICQRIKDLLQELEDELAERNEV